MAPAGLVFFIPESFQRCSEVSNWVLLPSTRLRNAAAGAIDRVDQDTERSNGNSVREM